MFKLSDYLYIAATIGFTVYGQLILKWRITKFGLLPEHSIDKLKFLFNIILDPFIISGFVAAFLASFAWMAAMTKFDLSYAYPFMSLNFVLVILLSSYILGESVSYQKVIGISFIVLGTILAAKSQ